MPGTPRIVAPAEPTERAAEASAALAELAEAAPSAGAAPAQAAHPSPRAYEPTPADRSSAGDLMRGALRSLARAAHAPKLHEAADRMALGAAEPIARMVGGRWPAILAALGLAGAIAAARFTDPPEPRGEA